MTREEKEQLEAALASLQKLLKEDDFMELSLVYLQMEKGYVVYSIEKHSIRKSLCIGCYDIRDPKSDGLMVISMKENKADLKEWAKTHLECHWVRFFTCDDNIDDLLLWISREGEALQDKYKDLTDTVQKALAFLRKNNFPAYTSAKIRTDLC